MTLSPTLRITLLFAATFAVGLLTGYAVRPWIDPAPMGMERPRHERDARFRDHMSRTLELTSEQQTAFFERMDAHRRKTRGWMDEARDSMRVKVRIETDSLRADLANILTKEQLERWDKLHHRAMRGQHDQR